MRQLVDFLFDKFSDDYHYKTVDIGKKFGQIDVNFNELIPNNGENLSKEILDDMLIYTHRDENDKVYIYCTTMRTSEAFFVLKEPPYDYKLISNHGVFIYDKIEKEVNGKKEEIPYLSHCALFTNDLKEEGREIIGLTLNVPDKKVLDIFLIDSENFIVSTIEGDILHINKDGNILKDIKEVLDTHITYDKENEVVNYEIFSSNCIVVKVLKKKVTSVMEENLVKSYIYNVSKEYIMNEFGPEVYINRIFNSNSNEYFDKGYIWLTRNEANLTKEDEKILSGDDMSKMEEVMTKYRDKFISYVCPLVHTSEDSWVRVNQTIDDVGGFVDGLNLFYIVHNSDNGYIMRFFSCKDNKIVVEDVPVSHIPHRVEANERTGVVNMRFITDQSIQAVTYFLEYDEVEKYSYTMLKVDSKEDYLPVINSLKERFLHLNNMSEYLAQEEINYLLAAHNAIIWDETIEKIPEIASAFWCNVSEEDVYTQAEKLFFGSEARFITRKNIDSSITMLMRLRIKESLEKLREKEENYQREEISFLKKAQKELGI